MIIIGEKINGAIPKVAEAIRSRDSDAVESLVKMQLDAGADYLDVCAGSSPQQEYDDLSWLINVVQDCTDRPICIDSPSPQMIERVFPLFQRPGIINSISGEGGKCEVLLPILRDNPQWQVIALCCDNTGVAVEADDKSCIAYRLIEEAARYSVSCDRIHIDPLVMSLSTTGTAALSFCRASREIKERYPSVKITAALSNVSYGMPARRIVNQNFLALALAAGLDSGIVDPTRREIVETIYAAEALLGKDRLCRKYNRAYRAGLIGGVSAKQAM